MDLSTLEYSNVYEQKMSPVAMFSQLERQKKLKDLTVIERILLSTTVQSMCNNIYSAPCIFHCIVLVCVLCFNTYLVPLFNTYLVPLFNTYPVPLFL
jgi:hypothetical protein